MEDIDPHAPGGPSDETIVERFAEPVDFRRVDPAASGLQDMNDAADDPAVIDPRLASSIGGKKRLKPRELFIRQPEMIAIHHRSPFEHRESQIHR